MRSLLTRSSVLAAALVASLALAAPALALPHFDGIFKVGGNGANNVKMVNGPDGNVWMTLEGSTKDVAKISPAGVVTEFDLPEEVKEPGGIAVGPEGNLWVTIKEGAARFSPTSPLTTTKTFEIDAGIEGINTSIVTGPDKQMWVATKNELVRFSPQAPETVKKAFLVAGLTPHDIDAAGSLLGVSAAATGALLTFTTEGGEKAIPFVNNPMGTSQGVAGNSSGQFVFAESDGKEGLGFVTPPNPATAELRGAGDPFGVALGSDGAYYFAMSGDDNVRRFVPGTPSAAITGAFPAGARPRQITAGPGNTIWVAIEAAGGEPVEVARISGLEPPVTTIPAPGPIPAPPVPVILPQTKLGKKPQKVVQTTAEKASVKFAFSSTTASARFECSLGHRVKPKGKKARFVGQKYGGCKSPKSYQLAPGRYRFGVRAVSGALRDSSPAIFGFKVVRIQKQH